MHSSVFQGYDKTERIIGPGFQAVHDEYRFDSDLLDILHIVNTVTRDINTVNLPKSEVIPLRVRKRIRSVQYSLLSRENYDTGGSSEDQILIAWRLGVLLYVGIIQNEFAVSPISNQVIWQLKSCLQQESFAADSTRALRLWLLFLAGSLVLDPTEKSWFVYSVVEAVSQLSLPSWGDARLLLETFAWAGKSPGQVGPRSMG